MQKIVPHLWIDTRAKEAAEFYTKVFPNSKISFTTVIKGTPSSDCDFVTFSLNGYEFMAISGGDAFKINSSISFMVNFDPSQDDKAREHLDELWEALSEGGEVMMPLDKYPYSERYGWVQDRFGTTWQLMLTDPEGEPRPFITPTLLFNGESVNKAEQAIKFYLSVFKNTKMGTEARYPEDTGPAKKDSLMYADFQLEGQWFAAMDSGVEMSSPFNEAVSLLINVKDQDEIDYYSDKLSAVPEAEQCGWLKDKFGVSWQVSPVRMGEMMEEGNEEQMERVMKAFLEMKRFNLAELERAYKGE